MVWSVVWAYSTVGIVLIITLFNYLQALRIIQPSTWKFLVGMTLTVIGEITALASFVFILIENIRP